MSHSVRVHQTQPGYQKSIIQLVRKSNPSCCYMINFLVKLTFIYDLALMLVTEDVHSPDNGRSQVPFHACTPPQKKGFCSRLAISSLRGQGHVHFPKEISITPKKKEKRRQPLNRKRAGTLNMFVFYL